MNVEDELATLRRPAPAHLYGAILQAVDLADAYTTIEGPLGPLYVAWSRHGVTACVPAAVVDGEAGFAERHHRPLHRTDPPPRIARPLARAVATGRPGRLPIDLGDLGEFSRAVLASCARIPPGEVRPYSWIATEIGRPAAVRAVGSALARNPVPILVPCHRVVRADGHIGAYAYGSEMKRHLLEREGIDLAALAVTARRGVRFLGSDRTRVYCFPTCRHALRIADAHRIAFRNVREAAAAGYRPCRHCRPPAAPSRPPTRRTGA